MSTVLSDQPHPSHPSQAADSVGIVEPCVMTFDAPFTLECNRTLPRFELVYETYGSLNADRSNAILICHALSGSHHAAGYHSVNDKKAGWWDNMIGPGKPIDTQRFFVVCLNNIGSCYGSTGPASINEATGEIYGPDFPLITIKDWVRTQTMLSDRLGIEVWHAIVGGSMGGMQALQWSVDYPKRLKRCVIIASTPKLSAQNIAFNEVARQSILSDPEFNDGYYLKAGTYPRRGLILARMVGHITYLTDEAMRAKFGRDLKSGKFMYGFDAEFQVESYLRYQGERFSENFDANTYLLMTKALDYFDPTRDYASVDNAQLQDNHHPGERTSSNEPPNHRTTHRRTADYRSNNRSIQYGPAQAAHATPIDASGDVDRQALIETLARTQCRCLIVSFTTDWRFAPKQSQDIVNALIASNKSVSYVNVDAPHGHDSFLFAIDRYFEAVRHFLVAD